MLASNRALLKTLRNYACSYTPLLALHLLPYNTACVGNKLIEQKYLAFVFEVVYF